MPRFVPGQRWISTAEPELGLGTVLRIEGRAVQVLFATSGVLRQYAQQSAPLLRAAFRVGQKVASGGKNVVIEQVSEEDGLLTYRAGEREVAEGELDDEQSISQADERLLAGRVDPVDHFELRLEALQRRAAARRSPAWGLNAARIDLFAHQLRVAEAASARRPPRVLLADEVGLGKTIEAGMIVSRQLATGRANRVLILLPESLVHQWFVEMLRRFNLAFAIFDETRAAAIAAGGDGRNPFEDEQLVITSIEYLLGDALRAEQVPAAGWDLLLVDEAHHLEWTPGSSSPGYALVERMAADIPGVILLTATPEQLGRTGHFARLRLLDSARYSDLDEFVRESGHYLQLSAIAGKLHAGEALSASECGNLCTRFPEDEALRDRVLAHTRSAADADALLTALIDRHGTGRVMFRSRRELVGGFPSRQLHFDLLPTDAADDAWHQILLAEFNSDIQQPPASIEPDYGIDPRLAWMLDLLNKHRDDKFLLICRSQQKVQALEAALQPTGIKFGRFHEGLGLVQRDRNAAWFAEPDGARLLLCSEIGSEGRNFQFAHRLLLWDLPLDPDLLEQRIGRLDRIGQRDTIDIHLGVVAGSAQHLLGRWYDEGINAFQASPADGRELLRRFGPTLVQLARAHAGGADEVDQEFDALIAETRAAHDQLSTKIHAGRDRLLELAAARTAHGESLHQALQQADLDPDRDTFVQRLLERFGVQVDDLGGGVIRLDPEYLSTDAFAGLDQGPQAATFERAVALKRDELALLRLDHPLLQEALDLLLGSELGNAAFMADTALPPRQALLQAVYVLECVADTKLDAERFLPPVPLLVSVDTRQREHPDFKPSATALAQAAEQPVDVARQRKLLLKLLPPMLASAESAARSHAFRHIDEATQQAQAELGAERERLRSLARINPAVGDAHITAVETELASLRHALSGARLRLDALRVVVSPDVLGLR